MRLGMLTIFDGTPPMVILRTGGVDMVLLLLLLGPCCLPTRTDDDNNGPASPYREPSNIERTVGGQASSERKDESPTAKRCSRTTSGWSVHCDYLRHCAATANAPQHNMRRNGKVGGPGDREAHDAVLFVYPKLALRDQTKEIPLKNAHHPSNL
uniref:Secreted protein n=1 Tax=Anopheles farauti TaxID=69004 RepID=A0A182QCE0_9DIPT